MHHCRSPHLLCLALSLAGSLAASAQTPPADRARFAAEPYVVEEDRTVTSMKADGTGTRVQTFVIRIQSESALRSFGVLSIGYPRSSETAEFVYARVRHADGSLQETPVADAIEQPAPVTREAPLYSDLQIKQLPLKNFSVGDTLEWQTRTIIVHPEVANQFWGQSNITEGAVVLGEVLELRTPLATHLTVWTNPHTAALTFTETTEGSERVDRWSHNNLQPTVGAAAEAAKLAEEKRPRTPEEQLDLTQGKLPSLAWTTFPDWAAVGAWYRDLSVGRATPDAAIKARVATLIAGKSSDLDKAQALYAYVSSQIRYIGVDFGVGRLQPHTAPEVLSNQFGDCKDKVTLLAAMFNAAGLHADPALIGVSIRFNAAAPSPASFNHVVAHLTLGQHEIWLDPTTELAPWQALLPAVRDQQALVVPSAAAASIVRTPASLPYASYATGKVTGTVDASLNSDSSFVYTFHDDAEIVLRAVLRNVSPSDYGAFVQNLMANLGFGGTTSEAALDHLTDPSQPLAIRFRYRRDHDKSWGDNRITVPFEPISLPTFAAEKPPISAIQLGAPRTETSNVELALPAGWQAELPDAVHAHTDFATIDVSFRRDAGKILGERKLVVLKKEVPLAQSRQYQAWFDQADPGSVPFIQLIPPVDPAKISAHTVPEPPPAGTNTARPSDPHAAELVKAAADKLRTMDPDAARKLFDEAKALNPTERGLWMGYAAIASQFGASGEAVEDLQRELTYFPDEVQLYSYIAQEQQRRGDRDAALATSRKWAAAVPDSPEAATALVQQLSVHKQFAEATQVADAALNRLSRSSTDLVPLRLAAADAQSLAGDKERAAATVAPLLDTVTDPNQVNLITYALAEGNRNLPAAEVALRKAIASLEAQTTTWTLTQAPNLVNRQQSNLAAAWDTLGWILYRQGKYAEALAYIEPVARVLDDPEVRGHLAAIAIALHKPALALTEQQKLRTLSLGPAKGRHGTAELRLLVVNGNVTDTGPFSSDLTVSNSSYKPGLTDGPALLKSADLHQLLPPGSNAHLIRNGIVNCFSTVCQLVLVPLPPS